MSIYDKASLIQIPSGYKAGELYSVIPNSGAGDFTFTGDADGDATRVNSQGLIETVNANVPRLDYPFIDGVVQDCPHLLLEPQRTNSLTYSEDFTNAVYSKQGTSSITSNTTTAPDGSLTADTLSGATGTSVSGNVLRRNVSGTVDATLSIYVKSLGSTSFTIYIRNGSSGQVQSQSITPNDTWQRVTLTHDPDNGQIFFGNTNGNVAIWGAQLEAGSYPTSYIPTGGSSVTRLKDTCKLENFSNMPNNYPFTAFVDMNVISNETGFGFSIIDISTPNIYFSVGYSEGGDTNKFRFTNRSQGTGYSFNTTSTYGTGRYKIAIKFISSTNFKAFIGGVEVANYTHTSSSFNTNINDILLGQLRAVTDTGTRNNINEFMLFNEALSDSELQTLTTL